MIDKHSKNEAQKRADQIEQFRRELQLLQNNEVLALTAAQATQLQTYHNSILAKFADKYDIDMDQREKQLSLGMRITSFLGALGFGASLFFLFYQFWGYFSTPVQVIILAAAPLVFLVATVYASSREKTGYISKILGILTLAAFVLNLVMFGQIFNITPSSKAFIAWAALGFLLAYASDARLLLAFAILAIAGFLSAQMGTWSGCYWIHFGERPENFFPAAMLIFLLGCLQHRKYSNFEVIYRVFGLLLFFVPMLVLANWGSISYLPLNYDTIEIVYQLGGFVLAAIFIWLGISKGWSDVVNCSNVFFVIFLYTKFFDWWWEVMPKYLFFLLIGLASLLFLFVFKRLRNNVAVVEKEVLP